jgi:hypothetical protein
MSLGDESWQKPQSARRDGDDAGDREERLPRNPVLRPQRFLLALSTTHDAKANLVLLVRGVRLAPS